MKHLLTIAGSDCSAGAGIQADLKTFAAHGAYGMSVITAVVAENTSRVLSAWNMSAECIGEQIDAVFEDIRVDGVKLGMLPDGNTVKAVAAKMQQYHAKRPVIDPVLAATDGYALMRKNGLNTMIEELIPLAFLLTPNILEAEIITGMKIRNKNAMEKAAAVIHKMGAKNVLIKGGHSSGDAEDILFDGEDFYSFCSRRIETENTHGTGCTLSAAITANLANGKNVRQAVRLAKEYITGAIEHAYAVGKGHGPTHHFYKLWRYER